MRHFCRGIGKLNRILFGMMAAMFVILVCSCGPAEKASPTGNRGASGVGELRVGDIFIYGSYEQDNDPHNGTEPIEWQVLAVENGRALVISRCALDARNYNDSFGYVTWGTCSLRKWLNGEFFNTAFNSAERESIAEVKNSNPNNPSTGTRGGGATKDRIFLLSIGEVNRYFPDDDARRCEATPYAKANGAYVSEEGTSWWWLRSPGSMGRNAAIVLSVGYVTTVGFTVVDPADTVRPAFWLTL